MSLPFNTLLKGGTYRIKKFLSSGGFGCTYEAEHVMLGKRVAIKEFFVRDICNRDKETSRVCVGIDCKKPLAEKLKRKFIEEARSVCMLKHTNIVSVFDVFEENGTAYFVMDYIDGDTLSGIIKRESSLPEKRALKYILQVCDALEYVHKNKRLHLDLKPGNIMIDRNGDRAVLIDFGASKQYDEESGENTSTLAGKTPGYAPLEQMGNNVTKFHEATDIYALGATFYKLLTGITPPGSNMLAEGADMVPLPEIVSSNVKRAISEAMRLRRVERPQSIAEFREILTGAGRADEDEDEMTVIDNPEPKPTPNPKPKPEPGPQPIPKPQPTKLIFIMVAIVALIVVSTISLWLFKDDSEPIVNEVPMTDMIEPTEEIHDTESTIVNDIIEKDKVRSAQSNTSAHHVADPLDIGSKEHKDEVIVEEKKPVNDNQVFTSVEQMPQFPGGETELLKWISSHIKYPTMAMENNIQGRVVVQFVVTKDGSIGEVKVARSKDPDLDKEAVRVVKSLPKFIPGKMNGQTVNVWYSLPVNFKLPDNDKQYYRSDKKIQI